MASKHCSCFSRGHPVAVTLPWVITEEEEGEPSHASLVPRPFARKGLDALRYTSCPTSRSWNGQLDSLAIPDVKLIQIDCYLDNSLITMRPSRAVWECVLPVRSGNETIVMHGTRPGRVVTDS